MAKKIKISEIEKEINNTKKEKKPKAKLNILFITLTIVFAISLVGSIIYYNNELSSLKKENKSLVKKNNNLESENEEIHSNLFSVIGTNSVYYVSNKLDFFDDNIVFQIEGFGNYYYSYDCMMQKVNGDYSYWAYNKEAAISKGLRAGGC